MKPWPAAILERYPLRVGHHAHVPTRPWWSGSLHPGGYLFRNPGEDGITLEWRQGGNDKCAYVRFPANAEGRTFSVVYSAPTPRYHSISEFEGAVRDFGENYDATMPMDTVADVLALLERLDCERPLPHPGLRVGQVWASKAGSAVQIVSKACHEHDRARCIDDTDMPLHIVEFAPSSYPYLVADPACPWLAPWSPA